MARFHRLVQSAETLRAAGNLQEARDALVDARDIAEESGDLRARVDAAVKLANLELLAADPVRGMTVLNPILALVHSDRAEEVHDAATQWSLVDAHVTFANCAREVPHFDVEPVLRVLAECDDFLLRVGQPQWRPNAMLVRAKVYQDLDRVAEAVEVMEEATSIARENVQTLKGFTLETFERRLADAYYESDRFEDAARVFARVLDREQDVVNPIDRLGATLGLARTLVKLDRPREAFALMSRGSAKLAMFDRQKFAVSSVAVTVYVAADELDLAREAAATTLAIAESGDNVGRRCSAYRHQAQIALAEGRPDVARQYLDRAMPLAEQLDGRTRRTRYADTLRDLYAKL